MSRAVVWGAIVASLVYSPFVARADLILGAGYQTADTYDAANHYLSDSVNPISTSFPSSGELVAGIGPGSVSNVKYSYTQSGGVSSFDWTVNQYQDGSVREHPSFYSYARNLFEQYFTSNANATYAFTSDWNGLGTPGDPTYILSLYDQTANHFEISDAFTVLNHTGTLIAGHTYQLRGFNWVSESDAGVGPTSAAGHFNFTATEVISVPEPSSVTLLGLGALGLLGACRRQQKTV